MSEEQQTYTPSEKSIDLSVDQDGGLYKEIITEGSGDAKPSAGCTVSVHYVGTLLDGTQFDSSRARGEKFSFLLGQGQVIKGWDVGVASMKKGEVAKLICRSDYAYGEAGSPPVIPANATLIFEVELFSWKGEDLSPHKDGGIERLLIQNGKGELSPNDGATVDVHLVGKYNDNIFEERNVTFSIGEGEASDIIEGIELALLKFKKGEKSLITLAAPYAFKDKGNDKFKIPPNATIQYEITLANFVNEKEAWELNADQKLEQAIIVKEAGTGFFKAGQYGIALKKYEKVDALLCSESTLIGEQATQQNNLLLAGYLNCAACQLKLGQYVKANDSCEKALDLDEANVKAHFRRGQALYALKDFELAMQYFARVVELDPTTTTAKTQIRNCQNNLKKMREEERNTYRNMFDKFAEFDAKHAPKTEQIKPASTDETKAKEPWEEELENVESTEEINN